MKKLVSVLLTLAVVLGFGLVAAVPVAVSAGGAPTIDGVLGTDEWGAVDFTGTQTNPNIGSFNIYVENDAHNLYVAAEYTGADFTPAQDSGLATALNIYIDSNPPTPIDGVVDNGDLAVIASDDDVWIPYVPGENDWDWEGLGSLSGNGGEVAFDGDYTTGAGIVEVKIPFSLLGSVGPGSTIGLLFQAFGYDCWPEVEDVHPNWPETYTEFTLEEANTAVGLTAETSNITAINVDPTSIDFGPVNRGTPTPGNNITVENIGGVRVVVDAFLEPQTGTVFNYLQLNGDYSGGGYDGYWVNIIKSMSPSKSKLFTTALDVPLTYSGKGIETATLIFEATAA